jgi:hypothetical protein
MRPPPKPNPTFLPDNTVLLALGPEKRELSPNFGDGRIRRQRFELAI